MFGSGYTDLFFLDEPTALAAGHRPCFECRRERATAFVRAIDPTGVLRAPALDAQLDRERRDGSNKRMHPLPIDDLPDGAMFATGDRAFAIRGDAVLPWSFAGYGALIERPARIAGGGADPADMPARAGERLPAGMGRPPGNPAAPSLTRRHS